MNPIEAVLQLDAFDIDLGIVADDLFLVGDTKSLPSSLRSLLSSQKAQLHHEFNTLRPESLRDTACAESCRFYLPSHGQLRLSFLDALYPQSAAYIVAASVFFRGVNDSHRLTEALCNVARRHDALYTYLTRTDDRDLAAIDRNIPIILPLTDLSGRIDQAEMLNTLQDAISTTPFDLANPPLWRWHLVRTDETSFTLVVAIHHFISDGWSLAAAFRELGAEYRTAATNLETPVASYPSFARQQRQRLADPDIPAMIDDARNALSGCRLESSTFDGLARPELQSDAAGRLTFSLSPEMASSIRALAGQLSLTVSSILAAMFALNISHFTKCDHFALGIAASNRASSRFEKTFGFFVNWLAVPVGCGKQETLASFIKRFHDDKLAAIDRVCIPFDEIARTSGASRTPYLHPVFQYMFVSHVPARAVALPGINVSLMPLPNGRAKLDLTMFLTDSLAAVAVEGEGDLFLEIEYNAQLFDAELIDRFAEAFLSLTQMAAQATVVTLAELAPPTQPSVATGKTVDDVHDVAVMFENVAAKNGNAPAVIFSGDTLTYEDLRNRAVQISSGIQQMDGGHHTIAILLERGFELPAALMGAVLAKATFLTLDPAAPPERNRRIVADAKPSLLLHSRNRANEAAALAPDTICRAVEDFYHSPLDRKAFEIGGFCPDDAAYLLYTSGSTGVPKGALIPRRAIGNFAAWMGGCMKLEPSDRVLAKTPVSFDAFMREILVSLCHGTCVIMAQDCQALDADELVDLIDRCAVTVVHATPTLYDGLLEKAQKKGGLALHSLSRVMCGGEPLSPTLAKRHFELLPECQLFNVYGPTECTIDVMCKEVLSAKQPVVTLGRPIDNCTIIIADAHLKPVEKGSEGEIVIVGTPVGLGYFGGAAASPSAFLDSLPQADGRRAYRTGDTGRMLRNGEIEYRGRMDRQVKIRGMRVECGEVEKLIEEHPLVERCAVVVNDNRERGAELLAAVRLAQGEDRNARELTRLLRDYLSDHLPLAMIPNIVVPMAEFPQTAHGKMDANALANHLRVYRAAANDRMVHSSQPNAIESQLIEMAESLLQRTSVAVHDNFFDLGGHSLNAIRLINQANKRFGTALTIKDLFKEPTIAALAAAIEASSTQQVKEALAIPSIRRRRRQ